MLTLFPSISQFCKSLEESSELIRKKRQKKLSKISQYIQQKYNDQQIPAINVICTHNSRRSHIGQLMFLLAADYYDLPELKSYSGGSEATAFNPRAVKALKDLGFEISINGLTTKIRTMKSPGKEGLGTHCFSKRFDHPVNPSSDFVAILVCTDADEACPIITGCDLRIALPFDDPKAFDDTELEAEKYLERCHDIGREIFYVMSLVKQSFN